MDPTPNKFTGAQWPDGRTWLTAIFTILIFAAPVAYVFGLPYLRELRARRILANGIPAKAKILDFRDTGSRLNYQAVVEIRLEVMPEDRPAYTATLKTVVPSSDFSAFTPGTVLSVKFDPHHPEQVAISASGT